MQRCSSAAIGTRFTGTSFACSISCAPKVFIRSLSKSRARRRRACLPLDPPAVPKTMAGPGPLLYRPAPKWQVIAAFGGAIAVHGIAVAIAFHKEPPPADYSDVPTATLDAPRDQPPEDIPTPPPDDIPIPDQHPPPVIQPEF